MFYVRFCNHKKIKKTVNTPLKGERLGLYLFLGLRYLNFLAIKLSLQRTAKTEQKNQTCSFTKDRFTKSFFVTECCYNTLPRKINRFKVCS